MHQEISSAKYIPRKNRFAIYSKWIGEMDIKNRRLTEEEFFKERKEVLSLWPTGKDIEDLDEAVEFQKNLPKEKNAALVLAQAKGEGRTLAQPRGGVNLIHEHINTLNILETEGGADLLPSTIDSYTRNARYAEAQKAIEANIQQEGPSVLNGLPAVNLGVRQCRKIQEAISVPLVARTCAPYPRLLAEILMASGFTSMEGGGITCLIPYTKTDSLEKSIRRWQYVTRMMGYYHDHGGVPIHRESYGPMTGVLVPPCITIAISVLECIMDCEQGVHNYSLGYGMGGNITQDVVAIRSIEDICREYLDRLGYHDITLTTYFHQYMGAFPLDEVKASSLISLGAMTGALSDATLIITKSTHEAYGIPTAKKNAEGVRNTKHIINMLKGQKYPWSEEMILEEQMIKTVSRAILDKTLELGDGDAAVGTVRAFEAGVIDVPFSPSNYNKNLLISCKDGEGAIRISDPGNVPVPKEVLEYESENIKKRTEKQGIQTGYRMLLEDILTLTGRD